MAGFLYCTAIRCADECTGSVQHAGDKDDRSMGKQWVGTTFSISFVSVCLAGNRKRLCYSTYGSPAALYVAGRCDRSRDHMDCH